MKVIRAPFPDLLTGVKDLLDGIGVLSGESSSPGAETHFKGFGEGRTRQATALDRLFRWIKRWTAFPDRFNLWLPFAFVAGLKELKSGNYDAVYSTSPPVAGHIVAAALQRATGLPWLADYRDPWTDNAYLDYTRTQWWLVPRLEKRIVRRARAVTTVSPPLADMLRALHGNRPGGVSSITNGYDPDDYPGEEQVPAGCLTITYAGMFYGNRRDPEPLLETIEELIADGAIGADEIRVRLFGPTDPSLEARLEKLAHPEIVKTEGVLPRARIIEEERSSNILLVLNWDNPYVALGYGGKVFEYLGARRPVLAWNPAGGALEELLERTSAGVSVRDRDSLKRVLAAWIKEFKESGGVRYAPREQEVARYSWDRLSGDVAAVLDSITG